MEWVSYQAAHDAAAWVDRSSRSQLKVTGGDRVSFVQGMVSNDVEKLAVGASLYATMLTAKGAMVADARILRRPEDVVLDLEPEMAGPVKAFLEKYLISEDAEVDVAKNLAVIGLYGPKHIDLLGLMPRGGLARMLVGLHGTQVDMLVHRDALEEIRAALAGVPQVDAATFDVLRVEAGQPQWGAELTEATIPLEASLDQAISYTKGCYIGQEVIARATHRGQMQKKLAGLLLGDQTPEKGTELKKGDKKVGWVGTVVQSPKQGQRIALAYVHRDSLAPGTALELASGGIATVAALPF